MISILSKAEFDWMADVCGDTAVPRHGDRSAGGEEASLRYVTESGSALLRASTPTYTLAPTIQDLARGYGLRVEIAAFPEGVLSVQDDTGRSSLAMASGGPLRFDQTQRLFNLIQRSRRGLPAEQGLRELHAIDAMPPTVDWPWRLIGCCLIIVGLCLRQNPGVNELVVTTILALPVATLMMRGPRFGRLTPFVPAVAAFLVGIPVAVLVQHHRLAEPAQVVIPVLASFIPGLALTVGSLELCRGALQAGAARFIGGVFQLMVLAFGLIASQSAFAFASRPHPLTEVTQVGSWSPLVGVGAYAVGVWLAFCAPRSALPALAVVIYVAWGIQQLSDRITGPYLSTFLGAAIGVVVAQAIFAWFGPPPVLTLNPLFRILAPGGLSLLRVTSMTAGNFVGAELGVVIFTFISVAMGLAVGLALTERFGHHQVAP